MVYYLDSSAIVKLLVLESYSDSMSRFAKREGALYTCELAITEVTRAVIRRDPRDANRAWRLLRDFRILKLTRDNYEVAGEALPLELRSLDAIHLAAAETFGSDLQALITYDDRMMDAARHNGVRVFRPGVDD